MSDALIPTPAGDAPTRPNVAARFARLPSAEAPHDYNFEHFRTKHLLQDARRTAEVAGVQPAELAPDFVLPRVGGGTLRLSDLRGQPVVLHFGSFS